MIFFSFSMGKVQFPALTVPPLSYLNFSMLNKPSLYFNNSLAIVVSQNDLHRLITFKVDSVNNMANTKH
jgi:hypothetical protein